MSSARPVGAMLNQLLEDAPSLCHRYNSLTTVAFVGGPRTRITRRQAILLDVCGETRIVTEVLR